MKNNIPKIILLAILVAVVVVSVLKILDQDNAMITGGGVAGGVVGGIIGALIGTKKSDS